MRVMTWNVNGANRESQVWPLLLELNPDIALLQEVRGMPEEVSEEAAILSKVAIYKTGRPQRFSTAVLVNGSIVEEINLRSEYEWVNDELSFFKGNFVACEVALENEERLNVVSVYSPAWPVDKERLKGTDVSPVRLKDNPDVWPTEIIWSALMTTVAKDEPWIVGGDYNISETFDKEWQDEHGIRFGLRGSGNREILDRMSELGFTECLRGYNDRIIPTFKHSRGEIAHQIDHLFVTTDLYSRLETCKTGDQSVIFGNSLSDHLPIIADFEER